MKQRLLTTILGMGLLSLTACNNEQEAPKDEKPVEQSTPETKPEEKEISVTGKITGIENGKDGYMATIEDSTGKTYTATISIVNLQKSGGTYKKHEVGETITVSGPSWSDEAGKTYIMTKQLN